VAAAARPLRTLNALHKLFGQRWHELTRLEVSDTGISLAFAEPQRQQAAVPAVAYPAPSPAPDKALPEPPLNDADLALSPPAGMLAPPSEESN